MPVKAPKTSLRPTEHAYDSPPSGRSSPNPSEFSDSSTSWTSHSLPKLDIATVPEARLRLAIATLASKNELFLRALTQQLTAPAFTSATGPKMTLCAVCGRLHDSAYTGPCVYHTGVLKNELFEFMIPGEARPLLRTILMWTCCGEDETCTGCCLADGIDPDVRTQRRVDVSDAD